MKSRLQRINPVEQVAEYNRLFGELVALEAHVARCVTGPSAPSDAGLATGAHDCVMTMIWTGLPDREIDSVIGCAGHRRGRLTCRGARTGPAGRRE